MPPQLPSGVQILEYVVHYEHSIAPNTSSWTESDQITVMTENYGVIGGLSSGANYQFWVEAKVLETDETVQTGDVVSASNATLFIPGIMYI